MTFEKLNKKLKSQHPAYLFQNLLEMQSRGQIKMTQNDQLNFGKINIFK